MQDLTSNRTQQKAARIAGAACLISTAIIVAINFGINANLIVKGNAAETANNILAHESLFRFSIIAQLVYGAGIIILLTALYVILKPVNHILALVATFLRLVFALVWVFLALNFFTGLRLISPTDYLKVFEADRLQALSKVYFSGFDAYYAGLLFWSLASTICSWLWLKSKYVPKGLAAFGVIGSIWCTICTVAFVIYPTFSNTVNAWWFDMPMTLFEIAISFWLLFKGLRNPVIVEVNEMHN